MSRLELLALTPSDALTQLVQASLKPGYEAQWLRQGRPQRDPEGSPTDTEIGLYVDRWHAPVEYWPYEDTLWYRYQRYDLAEVFETLDVRLHHTYPTTSRALWDQLMQRYGIGIEEGEVIEAELTDADGPYITLQAHGESKRWVGAVTVMAYVPGVLLSDAIEQVTIEGFTRWNEPYSSESFEALLLQGLNALNPQLIQPLEPSLISVGPTTGTDLGQVTLTSLDDYIWSGTATVYYHRLPIGDMVGGAVLTVIAPGASTTYELLAVLAQEQGFRISPEDVDAAYLPSITPEESRLVTIDMAPGSRFYHGTLTVRYRIAPAA